MITNKIKIVLAIFALFSHASGYAQTVYPKELEGRKALELGQLVLLLMPDKSMKQVDWDFRANSDIFWLTNGYETIKLKNGDERYSRNGLIRVNVLGVKSTVLKTRKLELGWSVTYWSSSSPKFGPEEIQIQVGTPTDNCFGTLFEGCSFDPQKSIIAAGIVVSKICEKNEVGERILGLRLTHASRRATLIRWSSSAGSGGSSATLTMLDENKKGELCNI